LRRIVFGILAAISINLMTEGDYAIIHFSTSFTSKNVTERLTLVKEDGKWQIVAYGIY